VATIAAALGSDDVLVLDAAEGGVAQCTNRAGGMCGSNGKLYLATPELLAHYGISPSDIDAGTQVLTSRPHLAGQPRLRLVAFEPNRIGNGVDNPRIQRVDRLPAGASQPNLLITPQAAAALKMTVDPAAAWLIQMPHVLTVAQINTARQLAVRAGMTIETSSQQPSLDEIRNYATSAGVLLALGVLAMTVGLVRSETVGDLRILAATGARRRTRRTLTAVTAGSLGALAAILGTAVAYLTTLVFFRSPAIRADGPAAVAGPAGRRHSDAAGGRRGRLAVRRPRAGYGGPRADRVNRAGQAASRDAPDASPAGPAKGRRW
jgi:putative ABC transport system permease protein